MTPPLQPSRRISTSRLRAAALLLTLGVAAVGWADYRATRRELLTLLIDQAASLRQAVVAAARSADLATGQLQATLAARLLDNARFLERIDRRGGLTQAYLDEVVRDHRLMRVTVFSASGERQLSAGLGGPPPWAGRGPGASPRDSSGRGGGPGTIVPRLLNGSANETVSEVHGSRWGTGWRLSAGIRRANGGAIVLNADAEDIADLNRQASLDRLLADIAARAGEVAYVIVVDDSTESVHGRLGDAARRADTEGTDVGPPLALARELAGLDAFERELDGHPVLEFRGRLNAARPNSASLRLGLALDGLHAAQRRSLVRVVSSLLIVLALGALVAAFAGLRQAHGQLQEQHARAQEALRRRDRLAAMGELASTVAHEVRNPLNAIGMSVQRLRREFAPTADSAADAEQAELLEVLTAETARINRIVQQFLEYARPPRLAPRPIELRPYLAEVVAGAAGLGAARGVRVEAQIDEAGHADVDPDQLRQALDNLLRNAFDASPEGAVVIVAAHSTAREHEIIVEDHGPGIPADQLPRIFDLYFTTKPDGTGVGLAVTHQVVEAHGGTLEVDTALGRGTRMIVRLPAHPER